MNTAPQRVCDCLFRIAWPLIAHSVWPHRPCNQDLQRRAIWQYVCLEGFETSPHPRIRQSVIALAAPPRIPDNLDLSKLCAKTCSYARVGTLKSYQLPERDKTRQRSHRSADRTPSQPGPVLRDAAEMRVLDSRQRMRLGHRKARHRP